MTTISPSILSADFSHLGADCRMVLDAGAQMLHYDVMDGHFVPNISFGVPVLKSLHKKLPDAFYDVHLMISHPLQYAEAFIKAGATLYNFHLECEDDIQATIDAVRALGCKVGLTIKPGTPAEALPYVFQRFYKEDQSRGLHARGAGLGLNICKVLVNLSGGQIRVESKQGEWCRFVFTRPVQPPNPGGMKRLPDESGRPGAVEDPASMKPVD